MFLKNTSRDQLLQKAYFQLLFVTERTQLNATRAQLLEKLRPIGFSRNLPISNDPVVRISRNLAKK